MSRRWASYKTINYGSSSFASSISRVQPRIHCFSTAFTFTRSTTSHRLLRYGYCQFSVHVLRIWQCAGNNVLLLFSQHTRCMTVAHKVTFPLTRDAARSRVTLNRNGKLLVIQWSYETQRCGRCIRTSRRSSIILLARNVIYVTKIM